MALLFRAKNGSGYTRPKPCSEATYNSRFSFPSFDLFLYRCLHIRTRSPLDLAARFGRPNACHTYLHVETPAEEAATYVKMMKAFEENADHVSVSVYTQTTDVELECDGFVNYDRTDKFDAVATAQIKAANLAVMKAAKKIH